MKKLFYVLIGLVLIISGCSAGENTSVKNETTNTASSEPSPSPAPSESSDDNADESNSVKVNTYELLKETDHFRIYCLEQERDCLEDLAEGFERAYAKVTADLDCPLEYKVDVTVYPDVESLHKGIGYDDSKGVDYYISAATIGKRIFLTSPLNPGPVRTYDHMVNSSTMHEFTHVVINDITASDTWPESVPRWLNEGLACYQGGPPMPVDIMARQVRSSVLADRVPTFKELASYGMDFNQIGGYYFTLPAGAFFVEKYGFEKVKQLIVSPDDYEGIFGKSEQEIWDEWVEYLKENYAVN